MSITTRSGLTLTSLAMAQMPSTSTLSDIGHGEGLLMDIYTDKKRRGRGRLFYG
jgi:hypothetical protein